MELPYSSYIITSKTDGVEGPTPVQEWLFQFDIDGLFHASYEQVVLSV